MNFFSLQINRRNPLARLLITDNERPLFSIVLNENAPRVSGFTLMVAEKNGAPVWNSGFISMPTLYARYAGEALKPKAVYLAEAAVTDCAGNKHTLSASFETGFLGGGWQAKWIEPEQLPAVPERSVKFHEMFMPGFDDGKVLERLRPAQKLRRTFRCESLPDRARLYATAHGLYEISINGIRLDGALLAPEVSAYPKRLYYQTYDPIRLLCKGENTVEVLLADGWWIGRIGMSGDSCQYGDKLGFLMQLELLTGKRTDVISTDKGFEGARSHIDYADLFVGERHDYARGFNEWQPCRVADFDMSNLIAQPIAPVTVVDELEPAYFTTPKGELMADFGQVIAGVANLEAQAPKNTEITLDFCEVLDRDGNYFRNIIGRNKNQSDVVVCGGGVTRFEPRFTYHGFRYVRISGIDRSQLLNLRGLAFGTELEETGSFECSNQDINRLQTNICRSTRGNMLSVPTDCPQREKMGWTGDIQVFTPTAAFNYDMDSFLCGWLENLRLEQLPDGEVPNVVPNAPAQDKMDRERSGYNSSPAWGDACILVPLYLYRASGDISILRDNLDVMERWLGFVQKVAATKPEDFDSLTPEQQARNPYLWTKGHQFGDWLIPSLRAQGHSGVMGGVEATYRVVGSCFYAVTVRAFIEVLDALSGEMPELKQRHADYETLLTKIREAVREEYISDDGLVEGRLQGLYVMALYAGIGDDALRQRMTAQLVQLIESNGYCLDTGFVSTPYLLDVLVDNGRSDVAFNLLLQTDCPSWLYMVKQGATTMWENWAAIRPDGTVTDSSFNHYSLGAVGDWLYRRIGGIAPQEAGYRSARFEPLFDIPLKSARAKHFSPYGEFASSWRKNGGTVAWELEVPQNATAVAVLPDRGEVALEGGSHRFEFSLQMDDTGTGAALHSARFV